MQTDIAAHIEKLLFLHDTLVIPGFGGFTAMRAPAGVDYVGGAVTPPSKTLTFNENLVIDDGILAEDIAQSEGVSSEEARQAIQQFVEQLQVQLNQREIVTLPGVGRLYKNYVQKIQFLPDATNFHAGSYGLPPLQFSPIARSREVAEKPVAAVPESNGVAASAAVRSEPVKPAANQPAIPPLPPPPAFINEPYTAPRSSSAQLGTGIGIGLLVCALAFGVWWWQHKKVSAPEPLASEQQNDTTDGRPAASLPGINEMKRMTEKEKTAVKTEKPQPETEEVDLNDEVDEATARKVEILRRQNEAPPSVAPAPKAGERQCILLVATLQDDTNADRLIAKLKGAGYDVYHQQQRGHQIGIRFNYSSPREIEAKKAELIRFTGEKGIFVKKK